ncbi:MAG TPA: hypothetical protein VI876_08040 [Dehalococcoidia bacterium]|nr:hypothetical protein [Dehalococcoidia bacterium]
MTTINRGVFALTVLFLAAGLLVILTALSAAGPDEEDRNLPPPFERPPATKVPRPNESEAMSLAAAKDSLEQNADLSRVMGAVEAADVDLLISLAKKTDEYCGLYRTLPEGCKSREEKVTSVFFDTGIVAPKPVALMSAWLEQLFQANSASLSLATRDSREPEGNGGKYFLVFRAQNAAKTGDETPGGTITVQGLALVVSPGKQEPIEWFTFLGPDNNGLGWVQTVDGEGGAKYQILLAPESVRDWPGMWNQTGD